MVAAILLAAGESRRMGAFKQLLPFAGKTFVEGCVDNLLASKVSPVIVVTGHRERDIRTVLEGREVIFVNNPDYVEGMSSSIKAGTRALPPEAFAVLIFLADQPQVGPDIVNKLVDAYEKTRPLIVVPTCDGRRGHPVLLDLRLKEDILAIDPAIGLRQIIEANETAILQVETGSESILADHDVPSDIA